MSDTLTVINQNIELWKLLVSISLPIVLFLIQRAYQSYDQRKERRRNLYSEAYSACMEYKEYPYVIYRRGNKDTESERLRISAELQAIQKNIAFHRAWIKTESEKVGIAYDELVKRTREVAGSEMSKAWKTNPIKSDKEMNLGSRIDWKDLSHYEDAYIDAVKNHLKFF